MPFLGNVWTISFDSCTWSAWRLVSLPKHDWSKYVLHCRFVRKGVTPHLPFIYNIGNNKEWPLPHPMVPENQRCCGGIHCGNGRCSSGRRATGWLKSGRRDRDRGPIAPVPLLVGRPIFCSQATDEVFQSSNCRCIFTWVHVFQSWVDVFLFLIQVDKI